MKNRFLFISLFIALTSAITFAGKETPLAMEKIPKNIMKKAQKIIVQEEHFKGEEIELYHAQIETEEGGSAVYEIQGKFKSGRKIEIDLLKNGTIEEYEIEFNKSDVPVAVLKAIEKKLPGFIPSYIEASHSESGKVIKYEFEGELSGNKMDIEVSANGRRIVISDN